MTLLALLLGLTIYYLHSAIKPLIIGGLIAYLLNPLVSLLNERTKWPRVLIVNLVFWLSIIVVLAIPALMIPTLISEVETLSRDLHDFYLVLQESVSKPISIIGWELNVLVPLPDLDKLPGLDVKTVTESIFFLIESITENMLWLLVILATTFYLLKDWALLREWIIGLAPVHYQSDVRKIHEEIKEVWRGYLRGNLVLMLIVWVTFSLAWLAIGLPAALVLGILAGVLTIIPDLGPAIAAGVAILVAYVEGSTYILMSNFWFAVLVFGIYIVLINIKNILVRPKLFGRSVHMHEGVVFIAIIIAVLMEGILGALVVVPVLASIGVIGKYFRNRLYKLPPFEGKV
jgi:predicted PurR-regulated permease PerM